MNERFVVLESYVNAASAHVARVALEAEGIPARVIGDQFALASPARTLKDLCVELAVPEDRVETAKAILSQLKNPQVRELPPWLCPKCGEEVPGAFDECWSCGHAYNARFEIQEATISGGNGDDAAAQRAMENPDNLASGWKCASCRRLVAEGEPECTFCGAVRGQVNPFVTTVNTEVVHEVSGEDVNDLATKAVLSSAMAFFCPILVTILSLHYMYRIITSRQSLSFRGGLFFVLAGIINFVVVVGIVWMLIADFLRFR